MNRLRPRALITKILGYLAAVALAAAGSPHAAPATGPIIGDDSRPQWLKYKDGRPFFMCGAGDPEDFLYRGRRNLDGTRSGDQLALINKLKGTGANGIYFQAIRSHGGDGAADHNPFIDSDPARGLDGRILDQWEAWFKALQAGGVALYFFLYDDGARVWDTGNSVGAEERAFVQGIVNRFKHHNLLIWVVAEEYQEAYSPTRVRNIAAAIRAADDRGHVIAVHKLHGLDFSEFADDPYIKQFAIQYNRRTPRALHNGIVEAWRKAAGRYSLNMSEAANHGTGVTARKKNWAVAMGGAYVMVLGMDIASTDPADLRDCGRLVGFMESTNFNAMAPHDELRYQGTEYVLARPGHSYIAYASRLSGSIGLRSMTPGTYDFLWFDPASGGSVRSAGVKVAAGQQAWVKPASIGSEVVVHIHPSSAPVQR